MEAFDSPWKKVHESSKNELHVHAYTCDSVHTKTLWKWEEKKLQTHSTQFSDKNFNIKILQQEA
jgi:transposase-like protein